MSSRFELLRWEEPALDALRLGLPAEGISLEVVEHELIERELRGFEDNQTRAAQHLDTSHKTLIDRIQKLSLKYSLVPQFKLPNFG